ncbi:MAG: GxxExxY protein [candidate division WOR-3 bacterium]|nr:GxxExxY protein [candidate division WOR-3 bacterium]
MKIATERTENTEKYKNFYESSLTEKIIQAAIEVHKNLGPGFLETIYEQALLREFSLNGIKYESQKLIDIFYKHEKVGEHRIDLIVEGKVIVELKSTRSFEAIHRAQVLSYLKATNIRLGLLINFGKTKIDIERIIL